MTTKPQITPYPIRMQPELREALESAAEQEGRSLHAEIIQRLERSLAPVDTSAFQVYDSDQNEFDDAGYAQHLEQMEIANRAAEAAYERSRKEFEKLIHKNDASRNEGIHQSALEASAQVLKVFKLIDPETKKTLETIEEFNKNLRDLDLPALQSLSQIAEDLKRQLDEQREKDIDDLHKLASKSFSDIAEEELEQAKARIAAERENPKKRP